MTQSLIVPVNLQALCISTADANVSTFTRAEADFSNLPTYGGPAKPSISAEVLNPPFQSNQKLPAGIHLHWNLPKALRRGYGDPQSGDFSFPDAPNRWLVTRHWNDGTPQTRAMVVESNYLSETAPTSLATTVPMLYQGGYTSGQTWRYLGRTLPFDGWQEAETGTSDAYPPAYYQHLNALGYGSAMFSAVYTNCASVFGFYDDLSDLGPLTAPLEVSYTVTGWFNAAAVDPLDPTWIAGLLTAYGIPSGSAAENLAAALNLYQWRLPDGAAPPDALQTLCGGSLLAVSYDPATTYLNDGQVSLDVTVGNTQAEALSTLVADTLDAPQYGDVELLLNALQYGMLPQLSQADGLFLLDQKQHQAGFGQVPGGPLWTVTADGGESDPAVLPPEVAAALDALNVQQAGWDKAFFELENLRSRTFMYWYFYMLVLNPSGAQPPPAEPTLTQINALLNRLAGNPVDPSAPSEIGARQQVLMRRADAIRAAADALAASLNGLPFSLEAQAGPRYWQPAEPQLLLQGAGATPAVRGDDGHVVAVRTDAQIMTSVIVGTTTYAAADYPALTDSTPPAQYTVLNALVGETWIEGSVYAADPDQLAQNLVDGVQAPGVVPGPAAIVVWQTPWLPVAMEWQVGMLPTDMQTSGANPTIPYSADYLTQSYVLDRQSGDWTYTGTAPDTSRPVTYSGRTMFTPPTASLRGQLQRYLQYVPDADLQKLADGLFHLPWVAQSLSGFNNALIMRQQVMQLQVADLQSTNPTIADLSNVTVRNAVGRMNTAAPLPYNVFCPLRAGFAELQQLRLVDAMGRFRGAAFGQPRVSAAMTPPADLDLDGYFYLAPRFAQPARLNFRWLAAADGVAEMNAAPDATPVCGWCVPVFLDATVMVFDAAGQSIGYLAVNPGGTAVAFYAAPGLSATEFNDRRQNMNPYLAAVVDGITANPPAFFNALLTAANRAMARVLPQTFASQRATALLMGRPLAVVRASLGYELFGFPATDHSWDAFTTIATSPRGAVSVTHGFDQVTVPVQVGEPGRANDGLVGYFIEGGADAFATFYSPVVKTAAHGVNPVGAGLPLTASGDPAVLSMLVDPRAPVHAISGVLPTKAVDIPEAMVAPAMNALKVPFTMGPVLTPDSPMQVPVPPESGGSWTWLMQSNGAWTTVSDLSPAPTSPQFSNGEVLLRGGWLQLTDAFGGPNT